VANIELQKQIIANYCQTIGVKATVPFEIPILEKLTLGIEVSWNGKTDIFFIDLQKTTVDQNCYTDC